MAERTYHSLPEPETARTAEQAIEVMRAWIVNQQLVLTVMPNILESPEIWGTLLADSAFHIANAMNQVNGNVDVAAAMRRIQQGFNSKMNQPLSDQGQIQVST